MVDVLAGSGADRLLLKQQVPKPTVSKRPQSGHARAEAKRALWRMTGGCEEGLSYTIGRAQTLIQSEIA